MLETQISQAELARVMKGDMISQNVIQLMENSEQNEMQSSQLT